MAFAEAREKFLVRVNPNGRNRLGEAFWSRGFGDKVDRPYRMYSIPESVSTQIYSWCTAKLSKLSMLKSYEKLLDMEFPHRKPAWVKS